MEIKALCQIPSKAFGMSKATEKVSTKSLKEDDQNSVRKEKSPVECLDGSSTGNQIEDCVVIDV